MNATIDTMADRKTKAENEKTVGVSARLMPDMLDRLIAVGDTWPFKPTTSQLIAAAVKQFVESNETPSPAKPKPGRKG